jgi:hypothetical protein
VFPDRAFLNRTPASRLLRLALCDAGRDCRGVTARVAPFISLDQPLRKVPHMTDIGSRAPRRRPGYAWLAVGPVAAAGAIAMFIACQPAVASTPPADLGSAGNLAGLGNVGGLSGLVDTSGLGDTSGLAGMNGTGDTGDGHGHRHHGGDDCGCMSPATTPATTMAPTPTQTTPAPTESTTTPVPTESTTTPAPAPTGHMPPPAPVPVPVGNNFPVTG